MTNLPLLKFVKKEIIRIGYSVSFLIFLIFWMLLFVKFFVLFLMFWFLLVWLCFCHFFIFSSLFFFVFKWFAEPFSSFLSLCFSCLSSPIFHLSYLFSTISSILRLLYSPLLSLHITQLDFCILLCYILSYKELFSKL